MELLVLAEYGSVEFLKKKQPSKSDVLSVMRSIDWNFFHQVCLIKDDYNWMEVGGNLNDDGLSAIYSLNNEQFVIDEAPESVSQMIEIICSYFEGDNVFKEKYSFTGEQHLDNSSFDLEAEYRKQIAKDLKVKYAENKKEAYNLFELIVLFALAPYFLIRPGLWFKSFLELKNENYIIKFRQKLILYILSFIAYYIFIAYSINHNW